MSRGLLLVLVAGALGACARAPDAPPPAAIPPPASASAAPSAAPSAEPSPAPAAAASAAPPPAPSTEPSTAPSAAPSAPSAASALFPLLRDLHALLERDRLSVGTVVAQVGAITADPGLPQPMVLRPRAPGLKGATLSQYPRGVVYTLELAFTPEARPTIQELRGLFGDDRPIVLRLHGERTTMFYPRSRGRHWSVAVIADASRCHDPHSPADSPGPCEKLQAATRIETIAFRRDPVE